MSTVTDIEGVLGSVAPYSGAITATMTAINTGLGLLKPLIDPDTTTETLNDYKNRLQEQQDIFTSVDSLDRANRLNSYFDGVCQLGNRPVGELSGKVIDVPVEVLQSLGLLANDAIKDNQQLLAIVKSVSTATITPNKT